MPGARKKVVGYKSGPAKARQHPGFADLRFYGDEFVFNVVSGMFYRMTPTAAMLLRLVRGGCGVDELTKKLESQFGATRKAASRDVELFLNDLKSLGISDVPSLQTATRRSA